MSRDPAHSRWPAGALRVRVRWMRALSSVSRAGGGQEGAPQMPAQSLRSSLSICLSSRFPMFVFWGPELVQLYNDSFVPVLGAKHPAALGQAARDTWAETWGVVGPMLERVLAGGEAAYFEDMLVILERSGFTEE